MQKIWFCSDYHFNHGHCDHITGEKKGALKWRQQYSSVEEMNEFIIQIHNSLVAPIDIVYHVGDFIWRGDPVEMLTRLHGNFYIISGNHDHKFDFTLKRKVMHVKNVHYEIKIRNQDITLCHYPMLTWNRSHWDAWHLYGHHHTPLPEHLQSGKKMNVNFDVLHRPIEFDEVNEFMDKQGHNWDFINRSKK